MFLYCVWTVNKWPKLARAASQQACQLTSQGQTVSKECRKRCNNTSTIQCHLSVYRHYIAVTIQDYERSKINFRESWRTTKMIVESSLHDYVLYATHVPWILQLTGLLALLDMNMINAIWQLTLRITRVSVWASSRWFYSQFAAWDLKWKENSKIALITTCMLVIKICF